MQQRYRKQTALVHEHKSYVIREIKLDENNPGQFEGYLSVFDNEDRGDDVVTKGAFTKTLRELKSKQDNTGSRYLFPILWMHNEMQPCGGFLQATEDTKGLFVRGEVDVDTPLGQMMHSGMQKGYICEMSVGYIAIQKSYKGGVRYIKEMKILEGSLITQGMAMNPEALVMSVKKGTAMPDGKPARKALDFMAAFTSAQEDLQEQWHDANVALVQVLYNIMADQTVDDKAAAVSEAVDQFGTKLAEIVDASVAAAFTPCLDWDRDSFCDSYGNGVYGVETDDDTYGYMSYTEPEAETKKGAAMSKSNHAAMGGYLKQIKSGMSGLTRMHKSLTPTELEAQENTVGATNDPSKKSWAGASDATTHDDEAQFNDALLAFAREIKSESGAK